MNSRTLLLSFVLLISVPLYAREKTDVVVMKNGDHWTCEVKGLDAGVLYVSVDYVDGTTLVDWSKVDRLESHQLFIVKTEDGSVYKGTLATAETPPGRPVQIQVVETPENKVVIDSPQLVKLSETSASFWQRFNGEIGSGVIYSKGNQSTQYTLTSQAEYLRERWSAAVNFSSTLSASSGVKASTRNLVNVTALHLLPWNNYFYAGLGSFLQSSEQGINLQTTLGGGVGRYFKNSNRTRISAIGGLAWQGTNYQPSLVPLGSQSLIAAMLAADLRAFRFSKTNLNITAILMPALSDPGRVRFNTNAAYYIKLFSNLSWNVTFYGSWDNQPPPTFSGSDYGYSSGLSWTFGIR